MKIKWPESVAESRIGISDPIITRHARLHRVLLLLRDDDKLRKHIQPMSASVIGVGQVEFTFSCTALGKTLIEAAFLHSNEKSSLYGKTSLTLEIVKFTNGEMMIQHTWSVFADSVVDINAHFDNIADSLSELLKEGI